MTGVLRSRNITDPWQYVDSYEFNGMILTLCLALVESKHINMEYHVSKSSCLLLCLYSLSFLCYCYFLLLTRKWTNQPIWCRLFCWNEKWEEIVEWQNCQATNQQQNKNDYLFLFNPYNVLQLSLTAGVASASAFSMKCIGAECNYSFSVFSNASL